MAEEQRSRGLEFGFTFLALGDDPNRTPSDRRLREGMTLNIDSGGKYQGYIGDLARNGIVGEPSDELVRALESVDMVQMAARQGVRAGLLGSAIYDAAEAALAESPFGDRTDFLAHGIGLVSHEAPRLAAGPSNPHRYPAPHRDLPLEEGMVISIETTLMLNGLGQVKLEDTVAVGVDGCEGFGDGERGWNLISPTERG
jgi:Xaa-Pro aminopeptidase